MGEDIKITNLMLRVRSVDFYGGYSISENEKYIIGYSVGEGAKGDGRCVLLEDKKIILDINIPRPLKAVVTDNGTFAVKDTKFDKNNKLVSTLFIVDKLGNILVQKQYDKLITDFSIISGNRLLCQIYDTEESFQFD
ncbi:MAG: hypothetical protein WA003_04910 [Desulfuromonadaceae bacterium]